MFEGFSDSGQRCYRLPLPNGKEGWILVPNGVRLKAAGQRHGTKVRFYYEPFLGDALSDTVFFDAHSPEETYPTYSRLLVELDSANVSLYRADTGQRRASPQVKPNRNPYNGAPLPGGVFVDRARGGNGWVVMYTLRGQHPIAAGVGSDADAIARLALRAKSQARRTIRERQEALRLTYPEAASLYRERPPLRAVNHDPVGESTTEVAA
jgi:hypothetical protein